MSQVNFWVNCGIAVFAFWLVVAYSLGRLIRKKSAQDKGAWKPFARTMANANITGFTLVVSAFGVVILLVIISIIRAIIIVWGQS